MVVDLKHDGAEAEEIRDQATIGVLVKAFHTLETIGEVGTPMPLRDITRATGLPKGTAFRILQTLCALGYAAQVAETGHYYLTGRMSWLGRNAREEHLKVLAMPAMMELHAKYNETINLGTLEGTYVRYVAVLDADRPLAWRVPTGTRDNYYSTALGRAMVSALEADERRLLISRTVLETRTASTMRDVATLERILEEARASGIAVDLEENDSGVVCFGVPAFVNGRVAGAISVSIPTNRYSAVLGRDLSETLVGLELDFSLRTNHPSS